MNLQHPFLQKATKVIVSLILKSILFMVIGFILGFVVGGILQAVFDLSPATNIAVSTPIILLSTLAIIIYKNKKKEKHYVTI